MRSRLPAIGAVVFAGLCGLATLAYFAEPATRPPAAALVLLPGVALYTLLNGSLLFGGGFGAVGDFLVVVLGSALAWSLLTALLARTWRWQRRRREPARRRPEH